MSFGSLFTKVVHAAPFIPWDKFGAKVRNGLNAAEEAIAGKVSAASKALEVRKVARGVVDEINLLDDHPEVRAQMGFLLQHKAVASASNETNIREGHLGTYREHLVLCPGGIQIEYQKIITAPDGICYDSPGYRPLTFRDIARLGLTKDGVLEHLKRHSYDPKALKERAALDDQGLASEPVTYKFGVGIKKF